MQKQKIITAIYDLKRSIESLEASLYSIKIKDSKLNGHLINAKNHSAIISAILRSDLTDFQNQLEMERYTELSQQGNEKFLKINSPNEESRKNIKKILDLKQRLVTDATKNKKTTNNQ